MTSSVDVGTKYNESSSNFRFSRCLLASERRSQIFITSCKLQTSLQALGEESVGADTLYY